MDKNNRFYKFDLFKRLIEDITNLVTNFQNQILKILQSSQSNQSNQSNQLVQNKPNKLGFFQKLKSFWPFNKFVKESLHNYLTFNEEIDKISNEIVIEHLLFTETNDNQEIAKLIIKFNNDFKNLINKYANELQTDYDKEKTNYIKDTGSPDDTPEKDIEAVTKTSEDFKDSILNSISKVLQNKKQTSSFLNNWIDNGEIKFEYFGEALEYLLNNGIDIEKEQEIKEALGTSYSPKESFYSKLLKIFGSEEKIDIIKIKVLRKNIIVGSVDKIIEMFKELQTNNPDEAEQAGKFIKQINNDPKTKKEFISAAMEQEDYEPSEIIALNLSIDDDLRKSFLKTIYS